MPRCAFPASWAKRQATTTARHNAAFSTKSALENKASGEWRLGDPGQERLQDVKLKHLVNRMPVTPRLAPKGEVGSAPTAAGPSGSMRMGFRSGYQAAVASVPRIRSRSSATSDWWLCGLAVSAKVRSFV